MKQVKRLEGIVWIIVGGIICFLSWKIHLGSFNEPGPGFVAFASGIALVVIGAIMTLSKAFSNRSSEKRGKARPGDFTLLKLPSFPILYTVLLLVGYGLLLDLLGYLVMTFLVMFALFYDRGVNRLLPSILASLLTVVVTYLLFETWLHCQLPRGIFPWW
jgi:putative tricarboxylic transport membrane protein